jgi:hypothetical protein
MYAAVVAPTDVLVRLDGTTSCFMGMPVKVFIIPDLQPM